MQKTEYCIQVELKALKEVLYGLEFEKADKEEFEINGKDVKCKGYTTTIDEDFVSQIVTIIWLMLTLQPITNVISCVLIIWVAVITLWSGADYLIRNKDCIKNA